MLKTIAALATAGTIAVAAVATPTPAEARGGRIAAGIIGGVAAGAIIGGALAGPRYGYYDGYYAAAPGPYYRRSCYWERQETWDGRLRRVRVCY